MQNATKLYRVTKAIQGLILVALGAVICALYNRSELVSAIGYCVASVVLVYGVLTIGFSYMFQRGIASTDMISGTILSALSVFLFMKPSLVIEFIPVVASSALFIYSAILLIETIIAFMHKAYLRGTVYVFATLCFLALGTVSIYFFVNNDQIVVLIIGIIVILAGLILSALQLVQPKKDVILNGSTLVEEAGNPVATTDNSSKKSAKTQQKSKKQETIKQIGQQETKSSNKKSSKSHNKKATERVDSNDVVIIDPSDDK